MTARALDPAGTRPSPRRVLFYRRGGQITCPDGHRIPDAQFLIEQDVSRCTWRYPGSRGHSNAGECGKLVYLLGGIHLRGQAGEPIPVVVGAEISPRERGELAQRGQSPEEILSFLGILL